MRLPVHTCYLLSFIIKLKSKDVHEAPALSTQRSVFSQTTEYSPLLIAGDRSRQLPTRFVMTHQRGTGRENTLLLSQ